jgi:hypothetical protein
MALQGGVLGRSPTRVLLVMGLASEAVYLAVAWRLPWWRYGGSLRSWSDLLGKQWGVFLVCLVGIVVLMLAYLEGWRALRKREVGPPQRQIIWGFACLFAFTLLWLMPITSDLFSYLTQAHLFTDHGANPLLEAVLSFQGSEAQTQDRLLSAYPTLYASSPSVYGPAWMLLSAPGTLGLHDVVGGLFYLKGLVTVAFLICAWLVERIARQTKPQAVLEALYLFAWNPLVLLLAVGDGHNDIVMMAVVLLAFWFLLRESWTLAFLALALSVWIKFVSVILLPLFVAYAWRRLYSRPEPGHPAADGELRRILAQGGLAVMALSGLLLAPFAPVEWAAELGGRLLRPVNAQGGATEMWASGLATGMALFAAAYVVLIFRLLRRGSALRQGSGQALLHGQAFRQLLDVSFLASLLLFLLGAARSQSWHLIWPLALAGLSSRRWTWPVVAGLTSLMLVVQVWIEWGAPGWNL